MMNDIALWSTKFKGSTVNWVTTAADFPSSFLT